MPVKKRRLFDEKGVCATNSMFSYRVWGSISLT